jgi:hypothetical protein
MGVSVEVSLRFTPPKLGVLLLCKEHSNAKRPREDPTLLPLPVRYQRPRISI